MLLNGINYPEAKKQPWRNPNIIGKTYAVPYQVKLPVEVASLWEARGYIRLDQIASAQAEDRGRTYQEQLGKTLWYTGFNNPACIIARVRKVDDLVKNIITYNVTHGTTVALDDQYSGIKRPIQPVCNLWNVELFRRFKVEDLVLVEDLSEALRASAQQKLAALEVARKEYMNKYVWPLLNEQLADINEFYKQDKIESRFERIIWATRYADQETLKAMDATITIYDLDNPAFLAQFIAELNIWARPFGIDLKLSVSEFTSDTFKPSHWFKHKANYEYSRFKEVQYSLQTILGAGRSSYSELVLAYNQIQFYKENGISDFLTPDYTLCSCCGLPLSIYAEECESCGTANPVYDEVRLSYVPGTILK